MPLDGYIYSQRRQAASACVACRCSQPTDLYAVDHADSGPWGLGKQFWPFELYVSQSHRWKSLTQKYAHDNSCFLNTVLVLDSSWPLSLTAPHHGSSHQLTLAAKLSASINSLWQSMHHSQQSFRHFPDFPDISGTEMCWNVNNATQRRLFYVDSNQSKKAKECL